jgi:hypothetical protein
MNKSYHHYIKAAENPFVALGRRAAGAMAPAARSTGNALVSAGKATGTGAMSVKDFVMANPSHMSRASTPSAVGTTAKNIVKPLVFGATVPAVGGIVSSGLGMNDALSNSKRDIAMELLNQGLPLEEANDIAWKGTYGLTGSTAGHILRNPYYYLFRGGGSNPLDQRVSEIAGSFKPDSLSTGIRQAGKAFTSGPVGGVGSMGSSAAINLLSSAGYALPQVVQDYSSHFSNLSPEEAQAEMMSSRYAQHLREYLGDSASQLARAYSRLSPDARQRNIDRAQQKIQELTSPYATYGRAPDGTIILRPSAQVAQQIAQPINTARSNTAQFAKEYLPIYLRKPVLTAFDRARSSAAQAPNPVQAATAVSSSLQNSARQIAQNQGTAIAADAYNRWNSPNNPIRSIINPADFIYRRK